MSYPSFSSDIGLLSVPISDYLKAKKVHCTDLLENGVILRSPSVALCKKYIAINNDYLISALIFDIDKIDGALAWHDGNLPRPNLSITNPKNTHAHLVYFLSEPVCISQNARKKPIEFLRAIKTAMTSKLGADERYSNYLFKNPHHPEWVTKVWRKEPYTLNELADYLDLEVQRHTQKADSIDTSIIFGRNCAIFDYARFWAYKNVYKFTDYQAFYDAVYECVSKMNISIESPLPHKEVKSISKSIAKWVWRERDNFQGTTKARVPAKYEKIKEPNFIERQRKKGALGNKHGKACYKGGQARSDTYAKKRALAKDMHYKGLSFSNIATLLGVTKRTIINWSKSF